MSVMRLEHAQFTRITLVRACRGTPIDKAFHDFFSSLLFFPSNSQVYEKPYYMDLIASNAVPVHRQCPSQWVDKVMLPDYLAY